MKIYTVGGAVRDALLGRPVHEIDYVVVGATPEEMTALNYQPVGKHFPVFLHPETNAEYALARTERKTGAGHQAFEFHADVSVTLEDDLIRRDLTINAIAQDDDGTLIDPYGGQADLDARVLRHVSEAFSEDPLRVLRVARFKAQLASFGFEIADETLALMKQLSDSGELKTLSNERIWRETEKALNSDAPAVYFEALAQVNALDQFWSDVDLDALKNAPPEPVVRYAALGGNCHFVVPNAFADLAKTTKRCLEKLDDMKDAEHFWHLLKMLDVQRRPERFEQLLKVLRTKRLDPAIKPRDDDAISHLQKGANALINCDISAIAQSDLPGQEKAKAIQALQITALR